MVVWELTGSLVTCWLLGIAEVLYWVMDSVGRAKGHLALEPQQASHIGCTITHNDTCGKLLERLPIQNLEGSPSEIFDTIPMLVPIIITFPHGPLHKQDPPSKGQTS